MTTTIRTAPRQRSSFGPRETDPQELQRTRARRNVSIVRSLFTRWAEGDTETDWADPDIDFCGPDLRGGRGIDVMASAWNDWLETVDDLDVVPDQFLAVGVNEVLIPARFMFEETWSDAPCRAHFGAMHFKLRAGKVVRLSVLIDREERPHAAD